MKRESLYLLQKMQEEKNSSLELSYNIQKEIISEILDSPKIESILQSHELVYIISARFSAFYEMPRSVGEFLEEFDIVLSQLDIDIQQKKDISDLILINIDERKNFSSHKEDKTYIPNICQNNFHQKKNSILREILKKKFRKNKEYYNFLTNSEVSNRKYLDTLDLNHEEKKEILKQSRYSMYGSIKSPKESKFDELGQKLTEYMGIQSAGFHNFLKLGNSKFSTDDVCGDSDSSLNSKNKEILYYLVAHEDVSDGTREIHIKYIDKNCFRRKLKKLINKFYQNPYQLSQEEETQLTDMLTSDWMLYKDKEINNMVSELVNISNLSQLQEELS